MQKQRKAQPEYILHRQIVSWLKLQYPKVLFDSDTIAAISLTLPQATRNQAIQCHGFKRPDIAIYEARAGWNGLFLEVKIKSPYLKDGSLTIDKHVRGQAATMEQLTDAGYKCAFVWSLDMAIEIISEYMDIFDRSKK